MATRRRNRHLIALRAVGDGKSPVARRLEHRTGRDQAADAHPRPRLHVLLDDLARAVEEHDGVAQRVERQADRDPDDAERDGDEVSLRPLRVTLSLRFPVRAPARRGRARRRLAGRGLARRGERAAALSASCSTDRRESGAAIVGVAAVRGRRVASRSTIPWIIACCASSDAAGAGPAGGALEGADAAAAALAGARPAGADKAFPPSSPSCRASASSPAPAAASPAKALRAAASASRASSGSRSTT